MWTEENGRVASSARIDDERGQKPAEEEEEDAAMRRESAERVALATRGYPTGTNPFGALD